MACVGCTVPDSREPSLSQTEAAQLPVAPSRTVSPGVHQARPSRVMTLAALTAPHFGADAHPAAAAGAAAFAAGDCVTSQAQFKRFMDAAQTAIEPLAADRVATDRARAQLVVAVCDARAGDMKAAAARYANAVHLLPHLADDLRFRAARAYVDSGDVDSALAMAKGITPAFEHAQQVQRLIVDMLYARGDYAAFAAHVASFLAQYPDAFGRGQLRYRRARVLERQGRAVPDAVAEYRRITAGTEDADRRSMKRAQNKLKRALRAQTRRTRRLLRTLSAGDRVARGLVHYNARRHRRAAAEFERALTAVSATPMDTCKAAYYLADSWFRHRDRTRSAPLFDAASAQCARVAASDKVDANVAVESQLLGLVDLRVKAAYQAGRSYAILGNWASAATRFNAAEAIAKTYDHSYADDARVLQAEAREMEGNMLASQDLLRDVAEHYPHGDMRAEALWRLAWSAYRAGDDVVAQTHLSAQLQYPSRDADRMAHARAQYWMGRLLTRRGDVSTALAAYAATARHYPLTYYALLALNRIREAEPAQYGLLADELIQAPTKRDIKPIEASALYVRPDVVFADPAAQRVVEWTKLGLGDVAHAMLVAHGDRKPTPSVPSSPGMGQVMWMLALNHHNARRYHHAVWLTRWHAVDYKRSWPMGAERAKWRIAYPAAHYAVIARHAQAQGYPAALQLGIVREESGFNPRVESWANAIGLSQLLVPTARRFGKKIGVRATARSLRDPKTNLAIGAQFLGYLWRRFDHNPMLIPPAYNAGPGAVTRWLTAEQGRWPMDEWVEAIPTDQARRYTKRVLSSYFTYTYLLRGTVPVIDNAPVGAL